MKVLQVLPTLAFGDAVGNHTRALELLLKDMGYETEIYALSIDKRLGKDKAKYIEDFPSLDPEDVVFYHLSTGSELNKAIPKLKCRKIVEYHNVTPPKFFTGISEELEERCQAGVEQVKKMRDAFDYAVADSQFNKEDLISMGYSCPIEVAPILIDFEDYRRKPNPKVLSRFRDEMTNIVFTGRIAPNKKQEDVIAAFYHYKKYFNEKSRLILVGSGKGMERYLSKLKGYVRSLGLEDSVLFTGHVKFNEILAYYRIADVFLCMSEHEGFCVPLVEAMQFQVPVVAYDTTAIGGTLGGSGLLLKEKDPLITAGVIDRLMTDVRLRNRIVEGQKKRLQDFSHEVVAARYRDLFRRIL
jgi:glycosyltransferase involved in cell wall biosynthesis